MNKSIYTLATGDRYPEYYPECLEKNLARWEVDLIPLTFSSLPGWWGKMIFFNPEVCERQVLFCDLDTIWLHDPIPVFEFCDDLHEKGIQFAALRDARKTGSNSSVMYGDMTAHEVRQVWWEFRRVIAAAGGHDLAFVPGDVSHFSAKLVRQYDECQSDQDFITGAIADFCIPHAFFPDTFMGYYRDDFAGKVSDKRAHISVTDLLSVTFYGKPDPHEVVRDKLPGHAIFAPHFEGVGIEDSNLCEL